MATLLLADDSATTQRVIELTLAEEAVDVVACSSCESAIAWIERQPPDIVLAAADMPGTSGYDLARHIKSSPHLAHIPVLLLMAAFERVDHDQVEQAGCDGVLAKPFEPQLVVRRVKELLARSRVDAAIAASAAAAPAPIEPPARREWSSTPPVSPAPGAASVDEFFDQLDAAFARLKRTRAAVPPAAGDSSDDDPSGTGGEHWTERDESEMQHGEAPERIGAELAAVSSSQDDIDRDAAGVPPGDHSGATARLPGAPPPDWSEVPTRTAAPDPVALAEPPSDSAPATGGWRPAAPDVTDELVERVAQRVLTRLSDQVVRESVSDLVSGLAEQLIRDEIERIKAAIK